MSKKIINQSLLLTHKLFNEDYLTKKQRCWHFCFAYKRNRLLAIGRNEMDSAYHGMLKKFNIYEKYPYRHAEEDCISRLWGKTTVDNSIKFVVIRLNAHNKICNSKPCVKCQTIFNALNVNKIFYSTKNGDIIKA